MTAGVVPDARALLAKYALRAKKRWGQNFLVDERAYRAIVEACALEPADWAVENTIAALACNRVLYG